MTSQPSTGPVLLTRAPDARLEGGGEPDLPLGPGEVGVHDQQLQGAGTDLLSVGGVYWDPVRAVPLPCVRRRPKIYQLQMCTAASSARHSVHSLLEGKKLLAHDHGDWHAFMFFPPPMTMCSPFRPWSWGHGRLFIQITMTMGLWREFHGTMHGLKYMLNILFLHMAMGSDMNFCSSLHP